MLKDAERKVARLRVAERALGPAHILHEGIHIERIIVERIQRRAGRVLGKILLHIVREGADIVLQLSLVRHSLAG